MAKKPFPILMVSGSHDFLRRRVVQDYVALFEGGDWQVEYEDDPSELPTTLSGIMSMMGEANRLIVVNVPKGSLDDELVRDYLKSPDSGLALVFCCPGTAPAKSGFAKLAAEIEKKRVIQVDEPPPFKMDAVATQFCVKEATRYGLTLNEKTAGAMVSLLGSDFGVLSFEMFKAALFVQAHGKTEILGEDIARTKAVLMETSVFKLTDALGMRNKVLVIKVLDRIRATGGADKAMMVIRILASHLYLCLQAANLEKRGIQARDAAPVVGVHPWRYSNTILPFARAWGEKGLNRLLSGMAKAEEAVLSGGIDPWAALTCGIVGAF